MTKRMSLTRYVDLAARIGVKRGETVEDARMLNSAFWRAHDYGIRTYGAKQFIPAWRKRFDELKWGSDA